MLEFPTFALVGAITHAGRYAVVAYATVATILTTACLTLQVLTAFDRRFGRRRRGAGTAPPADRGRPAPRSLFVRLDTNP
jgi:hypothetical protein